MRNWDFIEWMVALTVLAYVVAAIVSVVAP
ncbi:hypothetical protein K12P11_LOCUS23 [Klebsiella phage vB_Kpn_K12P1.1]|uniref:Uncharacterized protein n=1 Tax=Klebsiella phage vB_Kpn_K12P1.1 TaxID=3071627 RepID=A0AAV1MEN7_9CAUD|nr:hypothetical protein K12P11_LOCUS23 [Klebsiella phage vB_Kpn_K12P1.1]